MDHLQAAFAAAAPGIIKNLEKRNMEGYFYESSSEMVKDVLSKIPAGSSITWGGSESVGESGLMTAICAGPYKLLDRAGAKTPEEKRLFYSQAVLADVFLMSTNALTYDGELINIDGNGNRVACLITGPQQVYCVVGMNKLVSSVENGIQRIHDIAAPASVQRLNRKTPCAVSGRCGDCYGAESICSQIVVTRRSGIKGRIKVLLVAENA